MKNAYEIRGDITAIFLKSSRYGDMETIISTDKLELANSFPHTWKIFQNRINGYYYVNGNGITINHKRQTVYLHRLITDAKFGKVVDHINHDTLNNTDDNLRLATFSENLQNQRGPQKSSKTGIRGVSWDKVNNKYLVVISIKNKPVHIGRFKTIKEAENAAIEARKKHMPFSIEKGA